MKYVVISKKTWSKSFLSLPKSIKYFKEINLDYLEKKNPKIVFFVHYSKIIPKSIFKKFLCIQFHASDLPKFRGGSPIQNQIIKGVKKTKVSCFKVTNKIDKGDICLKKNFYLNGKAEDIYKRLEKISISMIKQIIKKKKIKFVKQQGKSSYFKRRKKENSNLNTLYGTKLNQIFDFIRMLDAKGYPNAFLNFKKYKIIFNNAKIRKNEKEVYGKFKIIKK